MTFEDFYSEVSIKILLNKLTAELTLALQLKLDIKLNNMNKLTSHNFESSGLDSQFCSCNIMRLWI